MCLRSETELSRTRRHHPDIIHEVRRRFALASHINCLKWRLIEQNCHVRERRLSEAVLTYSLCVFLTDTTVVLSKSKRDGPTITMHFTHTFIRAYGVGDPVFGSSTGQSFRVESNIGQLRRCQRGNSRDELLVSTTVEPNPQSKWRRRLRKVINVGLLRRAVTIPCLILSIERDKSKLWLWRGVKNTLTGLVKSFLW